MSIKVTADRHSGIPAKGVAMNTTLTTSASVGGVRAGLLYLLVFLTGFWLSQSGQPYSTMVLTVHKLIAVGALAFLGLTIRRVSRARRLSALESTAVVVTGLFFVATIVTGGLLSTGLSVPAVVLTMHQVTPFVTVFASAASFYLLSNRK